MKTLAQIKERGSNTMDGRDFGRLIQFIPEAELKEWDISLLEEYIGKHTAVAFTRDAVLEQLKQDVAFGFEKALDQRGISASLMFEVVRMWNWVLEEGLEDFPENDYAQYGLPLFKQTAQKYGFDNPIGDHYGDEAEYAS